MNKNYIISLLGVSFLTGCMHSAEFRDNVPARKIRSQKQKPSKAYTIDKHEAARLRQIVKMKKVESYLKKEEAAAASKLNQKTSKHYRDDIFYVNSYGEEHVKKWEKYFTGNGRHHMERYLERLPRYSALMKGILKEEGLPENLIYIALIESGFNSSANSRARAVGYWQFIRGTGKAYGLRQNWLTDERRDPIKSTRAAAQYFKALYRAFGSWHLAMSSYNAGEHRVLRAIMGNERSFWTLHERRKLPRETLDYVPKFIAAAKIGENPELYGFTNIKKQAPFAFESIRIKKGISLSSFANKLGVSTKEMKRLNPIFKTDFAPIYRGSSVEIRVPVGKGGDLALAAAEKSVSSKKYVASSGKSFHRVRRGDSLYGIARRYKTSVATLKRLNGLRGRALIRPGMKVALPGKTAGSRRLLPAAKKRYVKGKSYRVKSGDSLWSISRKFGMTVSNIKNLNKNLSASSLRPGQVLSLKPRRASSASTAEVYYVKSGDNLTKIAHKFRVSLSTLMKHNGLGSRSKLNIGKKINIPD